jgi:hypothetical protein
MRKIALALAAVAALSIAAPAEATVITTSYSVIGTGSGTFSLACDNSDPLGAACTLTALNFVLGSTTFTTSNAGMVLGSLDSNFLYTQVIGGNVSGVNTVLAGAALDDFAFLVHPADTLQTFPLVYSFAGGQQVQQGSITITQVASASVPEPASWAMMLLGFGVIGLAMRRRKKVVNLRAQGTRHA